MMQDDTETSCRDLGRQAYNNGDSFDDNPFSVGTFEHEMWSDGFESQRELCEWCERNGLIPYLKKLATTGVTWMML